MLHPLVKKHQVPQAVTRAHNLKQQRKKSKSKEQQAQMQQQVLVQLPHQMMILTKKR
jgi:hypothetical protein